MAVNAELISAGSRFSKNIFTKIKNQKFYMLNIKLKFVCKF